MKPVRWVALRAWLRVLGISARSIRFSKSIEFDLHGNLGSISVTSINTTSGPDIVERVDVRTTPAEINRWCAAHGLVPKTTSPRVSLFPVFGIKGTNDGEMWASVSTYVPHPVTGSIFVARIPGDSANGAVMETRKVRLVSLPPLHRRTRSLAAA